MSADDSPASDQTYPAFDLVRENEEKLRKHHQTHFVTERKDCQKFIDKGSFTNYNVHPCDNKENVVQEVSRLVLNKGITPQKGATPLVNRNLNNHLIFKNIYRVSQKKWYLTFYQP